MYLHCSIIRDVQRNLLGMLYIVVIGTRQQRGDQLCYSDTRRSL